MSFAHENKPSRIFFTVISDSGEEDRFFLTSLTSGTYDTVDLIQCACRNFFGQTKRLEAEEGDKFTLKFDLEGEEIGTFEVEYRLMPTFAII